MPGDELAVSFRSFAPALLSMVLAAPAFAQEPPAEEAPPSKQDVSQPGGNVAPMQAGVGGTINGPGFGLTPDRRALLHLGVDAGAGFDTNPYSAPNGEQIDTFSGDVTARVRPNLQLDYPGSTLAFRGGAMVDYGFLPGLINPSTRTFLLYQSMLNADLEVNRGGMFSFAVGDSFSWNSDPGYVTVGSLFNRVNNQLRAGLGLRPGGGALQFRLGYAFDFSWYLDVLGQGGPIAEGVFNSMMHSLQLRADYKFLPKTGFFAAVGGGWHSYPFSDVNPDSFPINVNVGLQGAILSKLSGLVSLGYSNPMTVQNGGVVTATVIGAVGQAEIQWTPSPATRLAGGFQRSFTPAPLYQYLTNNRFYAGFNQIVGGRFVIGVNAGYSILQFGEEQEIDGQQLTDRIDGDRLDGHLDANAQVAYFFTDWFSVAVADRVNWRVTNASDITLAAGDTNLGFVRNETLLLASLRY
jgi:Putative beta-barrel porin 2